MTRNIVVTGGSSGIGDALVRRLLDNGDAVTVLDRQAPSADASFVPVDLTDFSTIETAAANLPDRIDGFVSGAGVSGESGVDTVLAVNFLGMRELVEAAAPRFTSGAAVVTIASTAGFEWRRRLEAVRALLDVRTTREAREALARYLPAGREAYEAYNVSKAAAIVWSSISSRRFGADVRTVSVSPGPIETPLLAEFYSSMGADQLDPLKGHAGRHGRPEEVAAAIEFALDARASWISGADLVVDGGAEGALLRSALQNPLHSSVS